jgi:acetylornithine deacetylase/succinyl-diaminopimelate desuccinylase-like protein
MHRLHRRALALALAFLPAGLAAQYPARLTPFQQLGRDVLAQLVHINTTHENGNTTWAADSLAARFRAAGFPAADVQVVGPGARNRNLVVRYRGTGRRKPVLLLAHLDVVQALRSDWSLDPFTLTEKDGYFYGRGVLDVKGGAAMLVAALLRMRQEGFVPDRDLILALTAGEEAGPDYVGVVWLLQHRRDLVDAEYCLNVDAGGGELVDGRRRSFDVQASEKIYETFTFTVRNKGGHSSRPLPDNAIYHLARALTRLADHRFPVRLNPVTRAYFEGEAALVSDPQVAADMRAVAAPAGDAAAAGRLSADPIYNAYLRTTCVATRLAAGHADNALPQFAQATVNCRLLPDDDPDAVRETLRRLVDDTAIAIAITDSAKPSPPTPLSPELSAAITRTVDGLWGAVPIVPDMETGATDGLYFRLAGIPTFGVSGQFIELGDDRSHGRDERAPVGPFYEGMEFIYRLVRAVAS